MLKNILVLFVQRWLKSKLVVSTQLKVNFAGPGPPAIVKTENIDTKGFCFFCTIVSLKKFLVPSSSPIIKENSLKAGGIVAPFIITPAGISQP